MEEERYTCSLCHTFSAKSMSTVLRHIGSVHAHEPNFHIVCGINGCSRTYYNYHSFRKHLRGRRHQDSMFHDNADHLCEGNGTPTAGEGDSDQGGNSSGRHHNVHMLPEQQSRRAKALFLMKAKEVHKISQTALNGLVNDISFMVQQTIETVYCRVSAALSESSIDKARIIDFEKIFADKNLRDPFHHLNSEHLQKQYYRDVLGLVEPVERKLGQTLQRRMRKGRSRFVLTNECAYDVPLLQSLYQLLSNEFILDEVLRGHHRTDSLMEDFCDGSAMDTHPLYSNDPLALQILFYYDDVEVCNPIGSRAKKHKLALFYYVLGNLSPKYRSNLKAIQLLTILKHSLLQQYGIDKVLEAFMKDIRMLERDEGVSFTIQGQVYNFRGTISLVSADNLAIWALGGYKALASALRKCQYCMAIAEDMKSKFYAEDFEPRTRLTHANHISDLNGPLHDHVATTYGLQHESILNSSRFFHVTEGLSPDIMHDILEGALQYETKELVKYLVIDEELLTLNELNQRIESFPYGYPDLPNKPVSMASTCLLSTDHNLKQTATQMWCLARLLPVMIGELIPEHDRHWDNFLLMLTITDYVFAPITSDSIIPYIRDMIQEHHQEFRDLYPNAPITPKLHYMVHLPEWMLKYGPPSRYWCLRFEAKHSYFKSLAHRIKNFQNISKSLAYRHQSLMCYHLSTGSNMFSVEMSVGRAKTVMVDEYCYSEAVKATIPRVTDETEIESVTWVKIGGTVYKPGAAIILKSELLPEFGEIIDIIVNNVDECWFVCKVYLTECFVPHFHAYEVVHSHPVVQLVQHSNLIDHHPLSLYHIQQHPGSKFIPLKYHIIENI